MLSNVTLTPYPSFLVHFKHTVVAHPTKISRFSLTVTPLQGTQLATPPQKKKILNVHLAKNVGETMMILCILAELLQCKVHEKCLCRHFFATLSCNNSVSSLLFFGQFSNGI